MIKTQKDKELLAHMVAHGDIRHVEYNERGSLVKLVATITKRRTVYEQCGIRRIQ